MTPVRRQYLNIKHSYKDAIVLFRLGDFYEAFDNDAETISKELEIVLTARSMGKSLKIPMAGVPAHALESYLARLIKKGHKVAICEQLSDPAKSKGLVERDVVRVVTPGTVLESTLLNNSANNYLAAVVEEGGLAGLAYVDISTGEFATTQILRSQLPMELSRIAPAEVIMSWLNDQPMTELEPFAWHSRGEFPITEVDGDYFDISRCTESLLSQYKILSLESFGFSNLPLSIRSAGAIIEYLASTTKGQRIQLSPPRAYSTGSYMALDSQTRRNLELFQAGRSDSYQLSLLATMDLTRTPMGSRLLRRWLGQPSLDLVELDRRLTTVEFFFDDAFRRSSTLDVLSHIADLERILSRLHAGTVSPRELVSLKTGLQACNDLRSQLVDPKTRESDKDTSVRTNAPQALLNRLIPTPEVVTLIEDGISSDLAGNVGEGNIIREGFSSELDELKQASGDARSYIAALENKERDRTGIRGLKIGYNHVFGYYIEISKANASQVPEDYIRRQTLTHGERYIIQELKEYESLVLNAKERIEEMERDLYRRICSQIGDSAKAINRLAAVVGEIDVFAALAEVAVRNGYVKPHLNDEDTISIRDGRHPVVEKVLHAGTYVPNDVLLSNSDARVIVLTGPNMAGKSTFIRQTAIITLMAQIGSFVPAAEATIGLVDRIFTRIGLQDALTTGQSTFMVEMVETAAIMSQATPKSLVILDELGRGTSTYDGLSIARAVIEHIHNDPRLGCKTLFATHYHELTELADLLPGIKNFSVAVTEEDGKVVFLHRIVPGGADQSYGVHVAQLSGLPRAVVNRAREVLAELEAPDVEGKRLRQGRSKPDPAMQMPLFIPEQPLVEEMLSLDIPNLTPLEAINKLFELQESARKFSDSE